MALRTLISTAMSVCLISGLTSGQLFAWQDVDTANPGLIVVPNSTSEVTGSNIESRLPVSFLSKGSDGITVAALHEDRPVLRMSRKDELGREFVGSLEVGDEIATAGGVPLDSIDALFGVLRRGPEDFPIEVKDVRNDRLVKWNVRPLTVKVPKYKPLAKADGSGKLYVIHVVDTMDASIGNSIKTNLGSLQSLFESHIEEKRRGKFVTLEGENCSATKLTEELAALPVKPQDTLLVYYQGHGAYDPGYRVKEPSSGHFLDFAEYDLRRINLLKAMQAKGARLTVLLSDCCNRKDFRIRTRSVYEMRIKEITGWTGMEELLFCYRGTLDLTSASRGQFSWCTKDVGGWFTINFMEGLQNSTSLEERDWSSFWSGVKQRTEDLFQEKKMRHSDESNLLKGQPSLIPQEFVWDIQRDDPPNRPDQLRQIPFTVSRQIEIE